MDDPDAALRGIRSVMHFLLMGGYGRFIWSAYGVSATALLAAVVLTLREYFRTVRQLQRMQTEIKKSSA